MEINEKILLSYLEKIVNQIPKGKVTSYNEIAKALGDPFARKFVFQNIKKINGPWWRVINEKLEIKDLDQFGKLSLEIDIDDLRKNPEKYFFKNFNIDFKPLEYLRKVQRDLVEKIILEDKFDKIEKIAGVDLSYKNDIGYVVVVYFNKELKVLEWFYKKVKVDFPYIPSFLAFREGPAVIKALENEELPDILFVNGHGISHPVNLGLATYVGVKLEIPTIGITKKILVGEIVGDKIIYNKKHVGWVISKFGYKVYASPGNMISLNTTKKLSYDFWIKGKYPEPIRVADEISKKIKE